MAKRGEPPGKGPAGRKDGQEPPGRGSPPPRRDPPPEDLGESKADPPPEGLSESTAFVVLSESEARRLESDERGPVPALPPQHEDDVEPPPEGLTESTALVVMSDSDVTRLESDSDVLIPLPAKGAPPLDATGGAPGAQGPGRAKGPAGAKGAGVAAAGGAGAARRAGKNPLPVGATSEGSGKGRSIVPIVVLLILLAILLSGVAGYAVHRAKEGELEALRALHERELEEARGEARAREEELRGVYEARVQAKEEELQRSRREGDVARARLEDERRAEAAERRRRDEDAEAREKTLKASFEATLVADVKRAEQRERERAAREKLDLERRARETLERFEALALQSEKRLDAEREVMQREARAEILRREALLRKQLEEEKRALEAETAKTIELETAKLEERLRGELGDSDRGGFIREGDGSRGEGEGIDLEGEVWEHLKGQLGGSAEYRLFAHFYESDQPEAERARHEGIFKLRYDLKFLERMELLIVPKIRVDDGDLSEGFQETWEERQPLRPIWSLDEAWLQASFETFDVKAGELIFSWGTGDLYNPSDIVNPVDFSDLLDSEKLGVWGIDASYFATDATRIRAFLVPTFAPARIPPLGERFSFVPPEGVFLATPLGVVGPVPIARQDFPARTAQNVQPGLRVETSLDGAGPLGGFDLSATYFQGWNDLPTLTLDPSGDPLLPILLTPRYERFHMLAGDASTTVDPFEIHAEAALFLTEGGRDDDYVQYLLGGRWSTGDLLFPKDELRVILEWAGEWVVKDAERRDVIPGSIFSRAFQGTVLARVAYKPWSELEVQSTVALNVDGDENVYVRPEVTYDIGAHTKVKAGFDILAGPRDTFFGLYGRDDRFWLSFKLSF